MIQKKIKHRFSKKAKQKRHTNQLRKKVKLKSGSWTSVTIDPEYLQALEVDVLDMRWEEIAYGIDLSVPLSEGQSLSRYIKTKIVKELIKAIDLANKLKLSPLEVRKLIKKSEIVNKAFI